MASIFISSIMWWTQDVRRPSKGFESKPPIPNRLVRRFALFYSYTGGFLAHIGVGSR